MISKQWLDDIAHCFSGCWWMSLQRVDKGELLQNSGWLKRNMWGYLLADKMARTHSFPYQAAAFLVLNLFGARSQKNSYARHVMGLYLYSTGTSRQQITVMNHLRMSVSYVTLAGRGNKTENLLTCKTESATTGNRKHHLGTLEALSESMRIETRKWPRQNCMRSCMTTSICCGRLQNKY